MTKRPLDNIIRFPTESVAKFGLERVRERKGTSSQMEQLGQLNLFTVPAEDKPSAEVRRLPTGIGPFDEALLLDDGGDDRAADAYRKAIDEGDCVPDAYCNLGVMESRSGNTVGAFECFKSALKHDPRHFESHYNLGNLYFEANELRPARLHYEIAAELDPEFPYVYFNLGLVAALDGHLEGAIESLSCYRDLVSVDDARKAEELLASIRLSLSRKRS